MRKKKPKKKKPNQPTTLESYCIMKCYGKLRSYFRGFCFENFYCVQLNSLIITHTTFYCWLSEPCKPEAVSTGNLTQSSTQKRTNLNWVAQGFVKSSSEHLQGQRINDLFWQPVPMCNTLCTDNNWPNSTLAFPVKLELVSIDSNPTTLHLQEEYGSITPIPFHQLFERTRRSPPFPSNSEQMSVIWATHLSKQKSRFFSKHKL